MLSKRERLHNTIAGEPVDRLPVALWRAWPGDDQRPGDFVQALLYFQQQWDWDFVNIMHSPSTLLHDYGVLDAWPGDSYGFRTITTRPIARSLDWTELPVLDPYRGQHGQHLELVDMVNAAVKGPLPFVLTLYSPLTQAVLLAGQPLFTKHMRTAPERLKTGLNILAGNTLRLLDALRQSNLAGICYVTQHADFSVLSSTEFQLFGKAYDLQILEALPSSWWLNMLSVQSTLAPLTELTDYPVQVFHWPGENADDVDLANMKTRFAGAVCGGLAANDGLYAGTPRRVREQARHAIELTNNRRLILAADGPLLLGTAQSTIRAARDAVDISEVMP
jgi:uroporphyrinogen decarboxylase